MVCKWCETPRCCWCLFVLWMPGVAIAERLKPFKVKKFIYTDVAPRPELASSIQAEYGETAIMRFPQICLVSF